MQSEQNPSSSMSDDQKIYNLLIAIFEPIAEGLAKGQYPFENIGQLFYAVTPSCKAYMKQVKTDEEIIAYACKLIANIYKITLHIVQDIPSKPKLHFIIKSGSNVSTQDNYDVKGYKDPNTIHILQINNRFELINGVAQEIEDEKLLQQGKELSKKQRQPKAAPIKPGPNAQLGCTVEETPSNGDCGFAAYDLNLTRDTAYNILINGLDEKASELIFRVMQGELLHDAFKKYLEDKFIPALESEIMVLERDPSKINDITLKKEELAILKNFTHASNALFDFFESARNMDPQEKDKQEQEKMKPVEALAREPAIIKAFLAYDVRDKELDNGWADGLTLHALAWIKKEDLYLWEVKVDKDAKTNEIKFSRVPHPVYEKNKDILQHNTGFTVSKDILFHVNHYMKIKDVADLKAQNNNSNPKPKRKESKIRTRTKSVKFDEQPTINTSNTEQKLETDPAGLLLAGFVNKEKELDNNLNGLIKHLRYFYQQSLKAGENGKDVKDKIDAFIDEIENATLNDDGAVNEFSLFIKASLEANKAKDLRSLICNTDGLPELDTEYDEESFQKVIDGCQNYLPNARSLVDKLKYIGNYFSNTKRSFVKRTETKTGTASFGNAYNKHNSESKGVTAGEDSEVPLTEESDTEETSAKESDAEEIESKDLEEQKAKEASNINSTNPVNKATGIDAEKNQQATVTSNNPQVAMADDIDNIAFISRKNNLSAISEEMDEETDRTENDLPSSYEQESELEQSALSQDYTSPGRASKPRNTYTDILQQTNSNPTTPVDNNSGVQGKRVQRIAPDTSQTQRNGGDIHYHGPIYLTPPKRKRPLVGLIALLIGLFAAGSSGFTFFTVGGYFIFMALFASSNPIFAGVFGAFLTLVGTIAAAALVGLAVGAVSHPILKFLSSRFWHRDNEENQPLITPPNVVNQQNSSIQAATYKNPTVVSPLKPVNTIDPKVNKSSGNYEKLFKDVDETPSHLSTSAINNQIKKQPDIIQNSNGIGNVNRRKK